MKAKLVKPIDKTLLVLTATSKKDKQFLKDVFDSFTQGRKKIVARGTHFGLELTLEMEDAQKEKTKA